jgi:hypothetical protein
MNNERMDSGRRWDGWRTIGTNDGDEEDGGDSDGRRRRLKEWNRSIVAARQLTIGELPIGDEFS